MQGRDLDGLLESMLRTGLQATALGQAINEVNRMVGAAWLVLGPACGLPPAACRRCARSARWYLLPRCARSACWYLLPLSDPLHLWREKPLVGWGCCCCSAAAAVPPFIPSPALQIRWRLSDEPCAAEDEPHPDPAFRASTGCKIFLGYTSNLVSAGVREHIRYLVQVRAHSSKRLTQPTERYQLGGAGAGWLRWACGSTLLPVHDCIASHLQF